MWGYACCRQTVKNSYCLGEAGQGAREAQEAQMLKNIEHKVGAGGVGGGWVWVLGVGMVVVWWVGGCGGCGGGAARQVGCLAGCRRQGAMARWLRTAAQAAGRQSPCSCAARCSR